MAPLEPEANRRDCQSARVLQLRRRRRRLSKSVPSQLRSLTALNSMTWSTKASSIPWKTQDQDVRRMGFVLRNSGEHPTEFVRSASRTRRGGWPLKVKTNA